MKENRANSKLVQVVILVSFLALSVVPGAAQHEGHTMPPKPAPKATPAARPAATPAPRPAPAKPTPPTSTPKSTTTPAAEPSPPAAATPPHAEHPPAATESTETPSVMAMDGDRMAIQVGSNENNLIPMGRISSGTSWQPAATVMNMMHTTAGDWMLMFHYNVIAGVNAQGGPRGVTKLESQNWFMPSAWRRVGNGTLELRSMFSFEPFTFPPGGSPLLFQTGETYKGEPIIDRQHPHDLFMELSASYTVPVGDRATWFAYFGYPGEPALGPTAFMHRASASENPSAPLSHHLQDSSHISFGVLTTGFTYRWFKLEGSIFNGREPGENRYNFEANPWTSRSARLSIAPNDNWSFQISHGFLRNPEALEPGDVRRTTASISYYRHLEQGSWATSFIWGRNHESHGDDIFNLNGYTAESTVNFLNKNYLYTRLELTDKNQLLRDADLVRLGITEHHPSFRIGAYTFGGARDLWTSEKVTMAIGGDFTFYSKPSTLDPIYGGNPRSYRFFLRFRPGPMKLDGGAHGTH